MLAWFHRKAKKVTHCHSWTCKRIIKKGDMYIGRNTYGGIMAYCPNCCPDEQFFALMYAGDKEKVKGE